MPFREVEKAPLTLLAPRGSLVPGTDGICAVRSIASDGKDGFKGRGCRGTLGDMSDRLGATA